MRLAEAPRFRRIDSTNLGDHANLTAADECYFLFEYTSGKKYDYSVTNNLISNLKKKPGSSSISELRYKAGATVLSQRFPGVPINGIFIARRVFPPDQANVEFAE